MRDPAQLEKRIAELEHEVSALRGRGRGVRYRSAAAIGGGAVGYYACGGAAVGEHVVSATGATRKRRLSSVSTRLALSAGRDRSSAAWVMEVSLRIRR